MTGLLNLMFQATAVFAADAVSRLSGNVGVAAVTAGPGKLVEDINLLQICQAVSLVSKLILRL